MSMWRLCSVRSFASTVPALQAGDQLGGVRHLHQLDVVGDRAVAAAALEVGAERRAADRREHRRAAADRDLAVGVARRERERRRRLRDQLHHELAIPAHALAVDVLAAAPAAARAPPRGAHPCRSPRGSSSPARAPPRRRRAPGSRSPPPRRLYQRRLRPRGGPVSAPGAADPAAAGRSRRSPAGRRGRRGTRPSSPSPSSPLARRPGDLAKAAALDPKDAPAGMGRVAGASAVDGLVDRPRADAGTRFPGSPPRLAFTTP